MKKYVMNLKKNKEGFERALEGGKGAQYDLIIL